MASVPWAVDAIIKWARAHGIGAREHCAPAMSAVHPALLTATGACGDDNRQTERLSDRRGGRIIRKPLFRTLRKT